MTTRRPSNLRQHMATLWLLGNCAIIVFWPGSPMVWFPYSCVLLLAWPVAAIGLFFASLVWSVPRRRRLIACATVLVGAGLGWESRTLGPMFHVWWRQDTYLENVRLALAGPPDPPTCGPGWVEVDHSDDPPVRVAFFWFAAHGDVDGVVYDPTGKVVEGAQQWLFGARAWHMFGPWYRFVG